VSNNSKFLRFVNRLDLKTKSMQSPNKVTNGSDVLYEQGHRITFTRVGVNPILGRSSFKAFITAYNETWNSSWNSETVYGRIDPVVMFKNTERSATLGFKIPAADMYEAQQNMAELQSLIQSLYPSYKSSGAEQGIIYDGTITQSPLIRIQVGDLFARNNDINTQRQAIDQVGVNDVMESLDRFVSDPNQFTGGPISDEHGVLCYIRNLTVNYNLEGTDGIFECDYSKTGFLVLPKLIEVNMDFGILHEERMGWWQSMSGEGPTTGTWTWAGHDAYSSRATYPYGVPVARKRGMPSQYNANARVGTGTGPATATTAPADELPEGDTPEVEADSTGEESGL